MILISFSPWVKLRLEKVALSAGILGLLTKQLLGFLVLLVLFVFLFFLVLLFLRLCSLAGLCSAHSRFIDTQVDIRSKNERV